MRQSNNLSPAVKKIIVKELQTDWNYSETSKLLKTDRKTYQAVVKRFQNRGVWKLLKKSVRPIQIDVRDERQLLRLVKSNRTTPLNDMTVQFNDGRKVPLSERSIYRYLSKNKYHFMKIRDQ